MRLLILLLILVSLPACQPSGQTGVYEDYLSRIARTLDLELSELNTPEYIPYPTRRALRLNEPTIEMGFLEFLKLDSCNIQVLIAQRNSSLGKVMPESQRLIYEHRLMKELTSCLLREDIAPDTQQWMKQVLEHKQAISASIFWNTVMASPEMGQFFSQSQQYLAVKEPQERSDIIRALSIIFSWQAALGSRQEIDENKLEKAYQTIAAEQYGAQLITAALVAENAIQQGSQLISQGLDKRPLCPQGRETPKSKVMQTILNKFFIGDIQPHLARVQKELEALSTQFDIVISDSDIEIPKAFGEFHQHYLSKHSDALPARFKQTVKEHVKVWQRLLGQCGAMPSRETSESHYE